MTELRTRKPSGQIAYPLLLLEGEEKAGKSHAALSFSSSARVGRTFVLELDEPTADEYAPLGPFEIIQHNGTYSDIIGQLEAACAIPSDPAKPNVLILDSATALWDVLKDWASLRARSSRRSRDILAKDPDAEIDVTMNYWNDAKDRWYKVINMLRLWPGIGILVARGKEVAKVVNGQPVAGQADYSVQAEKTTAFAVSAWIRMTRPHVATLIGCRSLNVDVPVRGLELPSGVNPIEHVVFEILGAGGGFQTPNYVAGAVGIPATRAKNLLVEKLKTAGLPQEDAVKEAAKLWRGANLGDEVTDTEWEALLGDAAILLNARSSPEGAAEAPTPPAPAPEDETAGISPDVATMPIDEVAVLLSDRGLMPTEGATPGWMRRALSDALAVEAGKAMGGTEPVGQPAEVLVEITRDVDAMAPRDVVAQLRERGLETTGSVRVQRERLVKARFDAERQHAASV